MGLVIIHTMGRVGSSSVYAALPEREGPNSFHVHSLNRQVLARMAARNRGELSRSVRDGLSAREELDAHSGPVKIVTLVRSAFERNASAAFASLRARLPIEQIRKLVASKEEVKRYWLAFYDSRPFRWFDTEYDEGLNIDIYKIKFPSSGALSFSEGKLDILVLRSELCDEAKRRYLEQHVGKLRPVNRVNVQSQRSEMKTLYSQFIDNIPIDGALVDRYLGSRYMGHFYPELVSAGSLCWQRE